MKAMKQTGSFLISALVFAGNAYAEVAEKAEKSPMPQMDTTWYGNQLLWLAVSFIALYIVVAKLITPSIASVLNTRESAINDAIRDAERARYEAESTRGNVESAGHGARQRSAEIMAKVQAENTSNAAAAMAKLDHELSRKADHAAALLDEAVKKANASVDTAAQDLAQAITARLLSGEDLQSAPALKIAKR